MKGAQEPLLVDKGILKATIVKRKDAVGALKPIITSRAEVHYGQDPSLKEFGVVRADLAAVLAKQPFSGLSLRSVRVANQNWIGNAVQDTEDQKFADSSRHGATFHGWNRGWEVGGRFRRELSGRFAW